MELLRVQTSLSSVRIIAPKTLKGDLFTRRILPTIRWKSLNRREGTVISTQVILATLNFGPSGPSIIDLIGPVGSTKPRF